MGWRIIEARLLGRQLKRAPKKVRIDYRFWKDQVHALGPNLQGGYRTHALQGRRKDQKAARLDQQWRVIFRVVEDELIVEALELTPHHY
jgi:mRNA-degrading endonuclease YafQ of YafQ-DinJ toxin-antitoxin module